MTKNEEILTEKVKELEKECYNKGVIISAVEQILCTLVDESCTDNEEIKNDSGKYIVPMLITLHSVMGILSRGLSIEDVEARINKTAPLEVKELYTLVMQRMK